MKKVFLMITMALLLMGSSSAWGQAYEADLWKDVDPSVCPNWYPFYFTVSNGDASPITSGTLYAIVGDESRGTATFEPEIECFKLDVKYKAEEPLNEPIVRVIYIDGTNYYESATLSFNQNSESGNYSIDNPHEFNIAEGHEAYLSFVITSAKWATVTLPFEAGVPEGIIAYTWEGEVNEAIGGNGTGYMILREAASFAANTPYIVYSETAKRYTVKGTIKGAIPLVSTVGCLTGNYAPIKLQAGDYAMQKQNEHVGFYKVPEDKTPTLPANRAFIMHEHVPQGIMGFFIETSDVDKIERIESEEMNVPLYDLSGRIVNMPIKGGIYIKNGKKILR